MCRKENNAKMNKSVVPNKHVGRNLEKERILTLTKLCFIDLSFFRPVAKKPRSPTKPPGPTPNGPKKSSTHSQMNNTRISPTNVPVAARTSPTTTTVTPTPAQFRVLSFNDL